MASWECAAVRLARDPHLENVRVLDILGWTVADLERTLPVERIQDGTLMAIDYLQLIQGPADVTTQVQRLARELKLRVILGAMAPREVSLVAEFAGPAAPAAEVLRTFNDHLPAMRGADARHMARLAVLVGSPAALTRRLIISQPHPDLGTVDSVHGLTLPQPD